MEELITDKVYYSGYVLTGWIMYKTGKVEGVRVWENKRVEIDIDCERERKGMFSCSFKYLNI